MKYNRRKNAVISLNTGGISQIGTRRLGRIHDGTAAAIL